MISNNNLKKIGQTNSRSIPSFSDIFKKQKKVVQFKDTPPQKTNTTSEIVGNPPGGMHYSSDDHLSTSTTDGRNKIKF